MNRRSRPAAPATLALLLALALGAGCGHYGPPKRGDLPTAAAADRGPTLVETGAVDEECEDEEAPAIP